jgi:hypothetical protein
MRVVDMADGGIEVAMRVAQTEELLHWICGYGKSATVVAPAALAAKIAERRGG